MSFFRKPFLWFTFIALLLTGCDLLEPAQPGELLVTLIPPEEQTVLAPVMTLPAGGRNTPTPPPSSGEEGLTVYFSEPGADAPAVEAALARAIGAAQASVDVAIYNFTMEDVGDALLDAQRRGVRVRLVMEAENMDGILPAGLEAAGVEIRGDEGSGLMHDKFVVIDNREVWTGSMNLAPASAGRDHNNFVRIVSAEAAANFTHEFEEMFTRGWFGADSEPEDTPYPVFDVAGRQVEVLFSPDDGVQDRLVELLGEAETSIAFLAYSFTADPLAEALLERAEAGVWVGGVFDSEQYQTNTGTEYDRLRAAGIDARLDANRGLMHHKVFVIDEQIVVFGSYNFSRNAEERNDENVVIVYDPGLAGQFLAEFAAIYDAAQP